MIWHSPNKPYFHKWINNYTHNSFHIQNWSFKCVTVKIKRNYIGSSDDFWGGGGDLPSVMLVICAIPVPVRHLHLHLILEENLHQQMEIFFINNWRKPCMQLVCKANSRQRDIFSNGRYITCAISLNIFWMFFSSSSFTDLSEKLGY